jgi:ATP-dependent Clp protease ATP-binding subunit ClpA
MQLDRYTQKAQEAIAAAQKAAEGMESPVLDAEHLLHALVEPDDGVPAETLRRIGVDLPAFRGELAGILGRRARIKGGSMSLDPRAKRVLELAEEEARRLGDEYVSTEHLLLGVLEVGGEARPWSATAPAAKRSSARCKASAAASESPRRTRRAPTRRSRSTAVT